MADFNNKSLEKILGSNIYYYDVEEMIELMGLYFRDRIKFEPRFNGEKKDNLIYAIIDICKKINKICVQELGIEPFITEPISKKDVHKLIYKYFEMQMNFNDPNSKYMTEENVFGYDSECFTGDVVCYMCSKCKNTMEYYVEIVNESKEKNGHIGMKCKCGETLFPLFIRDKDRKVIMKD